MCSAWVKQHSRPELSLWQIEKIFSDPLLRTNIEIVNLTGGEPTMRLDMAQIIRVVTQQCLKLKRIDIPTNGINTCNVLDAVERALVVLLPTDVRLNVTVSVDGVGQVHEKVRGVSGIFPGIEKTIFGLKDLTTLYPYLSVSLNATISKENICGLDGLRDYARSLGLGINFTLAAISEIGVESFGMKDRFEMSDTDKKQVVSFFERLISEDAVGKDYGHYILNWLKTGKRTLPCSFRRGKAILLESDGEYYACGNFKEFRLGNLLVESFDSGCKKIASVKKYFSKRCSGCISNCYIAT